MKRKSKVQITPVQALLIGFFIVIIMGTLLLMLPISVKGDKPLSFLDAMFTATSASCVTGLTVADTGSFFSSFGQVVILFLIQLGGLGFMTIAAYAITLFGKNLSLTERMTVAEGLGESSSAFAVRIAKTATTITFISEGIGAILLSIRFIPAYGVGNGIFYSIFHSISAFCNAGFDVFGYGDSLVRFQSDAFINIVLIALIITGGLGFMVIADLNPFKKKLRLKVQTKVVLIATAIFIFVPALLFLIFEYNNPETMGNMAFPQKMLSSIFQSVTCRTAGFDAIGQANLTEQSKLLSSALMITGGAPSGTAGGIKITTVSILILTAITYIKGRKDTVIFKRRISHDATKRALSVFVFALSLAFIAAMVIMCVESSSLADAMFETVSALGTTGLSVGISSQAEAISKITLILLMYIGRVGILSFTVGLVKSDDGGRYINYPYEDLMV